MSRALGSTAPSGEAVRLLSLGLGMFVFAGGLISFLGWALNVPRLTDWDGGGISIQANTAVAAMAAGAALVLLHFELRWGTIAVGTVTGLAGGSALFQHISGMNLGVDTILMFGRPWGSGGTVSPGRMGLPASVSWSLIGCALVCSGRRSSGRIAVVVGLFTILISSLSLLGFAFGAGKLVSIPKLTTIALQTAILILGTGLGLLAAYPRHDPMRTLLEDSGAGVLARRALPMVLVLPIILGLVRIFIQEIGLVDLRFGTALRTVTELVLLSAVLWWGVVAVRKRELELRESQQRLREADRRKDEFLATLAHELRNPLAPVRNSVEIMKRNPANPTLIESARATMERQITHMVRLIDDLIDVSRISNNKLELRKERLELAGVIRQALEVSAPQIDCAGHQVDVSLPKEPLFVHADAVRLAQVLSNVLNNACKYTEPGGTIAITATRETDQVEIRVRDNGIGIASEHLPQIFKMFSQVASPIGGGGGGLGIGLSLAKRIVELHGGVIFAHSEGPGKGSEFTIRLPAAHPAVPAEDKPVEKRAASAGSPKGARVLVVDDNVDSAKSMAMLLKLNGCMADTAFDGPSALEAAESVRPDVVLLDIGLPTLSGYEVAKKIREHSWGKGTVLIALTGWGQEQDRKRSGEAGFDAHLVKPVEPEALFELVARLTSANSPSVEPSHQGAQAYYEQDGTQVSGGGYRTRRESFDGGCTPAQ